MTDDMALKLLATVESMMAELRVVREANEAALAENRAERQARDELFRLRKAAADRKAKSRQSVVTGQSRDTSRDSHVTEGSLKLVDLELKAKAKDPVVTGQSRDKRLSRDKPETGPTWKAYAMALHARHGISPLRDKRTNSQMLHFVERVGVQDAPEIAAFYVGMNSDFYVKQRHPVSLLDAQAEPIRAHWLAGREVTGTEARQQERTAANVNGWNALLSEEGRKHGMD